MKIEKIEESKENGKREKMMDLLILNCVSELVNKNSK